MSVHPDFLAYLTTIKIYAAEIASTVVFVAYVTREALQALKSLTNSEEK